MTPTAPTEPRVLIVEDDAIVSVYLGRALEHGGYGSVEASSGAAAMEAIAEFPSLAVALVDGLLPDTHGAALAARMLDDPLSRHLAICFVTGALLHPPPPRAGVAALTKPLRAAQLIAQVADLIAWRDAGGSPMSERRGALRDIETGFLIRP